MNSRLLTKLTLSGMKKNKKTLIPFLLAGTICATVYYILASLAFGPYIYHDHKEVFYGAQTIAILLESGSQVIFLFSAIFLLYANQFVMRDRRREIGLYGILGLSKVNIAVMLIEETLIKMVICIGGGIGIGSFLNKIMLLILFRIVDQEPVAGLWISKMALTNTVILFSIIFAISFIFNIFTVNVGNPVELLRSNKQGEKEPKVKWVTFITGVITLGIGYYTALSCKSAGEAISKIFFSIFMVIIGSYCLFTAGSIFILKLLKNNKRFYYKTRNFISVSNLMYRMKHNAAGLASICVLSTGVILLVTCATSLMAIGKKNVDMIYPRDVMVSSVCGEEDYEEIYTKLIKAAARTAKAECSDIVVYRCKESIWETGDAGYSYSSGQGGFDLDRQSVICILTVENYNQYADANVALQEGEILYADTNNNKLDMLTLEGRSYPVVGAPDINKLRELSDSTMALFNNAYIVVSDEVMAEAMIKDDPMADGANESTIIAGFNVTGKLSEKQVSKIKTELERISEHAEASFKQEDEKVFVSMYGGAFFVGIFLAIIFLLATVMIIYYKQMSEGFEDQNRYQILKKVGLSEREVQITIRRQVMILFFLPVVTAILHMVAASRILRLFLRMLLIVDSFTFNMSIAVVALIFVAVYAIVYKITSREYYKIVNM